MVIENSCKCKYCGEKIDYFFRIRQSNVNVESYIVLERQRRAEEVFPFDNGYRVTVRCPKPLCNKKLFFEYDELGNYVGEL